MNKYNAKKIIIDDIKFDSKRESEYYLIYKEKEQNGEIHNLRLQVPYVLIDAYTNGECKKIREMKYVADFVYEDNENKTHVIDVKGIVLKEFKMKKKIFDYKYYPLYIEIVK